MRTIETIIDAFKYLFTNPNLDAHFNNKKSQEILKFIIH